ncbi:MAG: prepilin-type N-terminal cleavage/methylation domain-containing protein [Oscillospiraceae bacterium]|nr:prepilin-type N-terminal cleavage/methylation domain-containing protein [Oscillospiraceae bacterium]
MKKVLKGFTLIELIVVMAILVILMAGIMNMFKPIRETYVDATLYEAQRTAQNGVVQYITESVRYATDLGIYTKGTNNVNNVTNAVETFNKEYLKANGIDPDDAANATLVANTLKEVKMKAEVIIIDNTTEYFFDGEKYKGRILRRKFEKETVGGVKQNKQLTNDAEDPTKIAACRMALGDAYYGASDYTISLGVSQDASKVGDPESGIKVTVASNPSYANRQVMSDDNVTAGKIVSNSGLVMCKNLQSPINGMFDTLSYNSTSSTGDNTKVYIVYLNEKIDVTP